MRTLAICLILMFGICPSILAQQPKNEATDRISVYTTYQHAGNFGSYTLLGNLSLNVKPWFSLHYNLGFGMTERHRIYVHSPATTGLGMILFLSSLDGDSGWLSILGILLMIAPEGISFHIKPNNNYILSPYINVNSLDFFHSNQEFNPHLSLESGLRLDRNLGQNMVLSSFLGAKMIESKGLGFHIGIGLGWKL